MSTPKLLSVGTLTSDDATVIYEVPSNVAVELTQLTVFSQYNLGVEEYKVSIANYIGGEWQGVTTFIKHYINFEETRFVVLGKLALNPSCRVYIDPTHASALTYLLSGIEYQL